MYLDFGDPFFPLRESIKAYSRGNEVILKDMTFDMMHHLVVKHRGM